METNDKLADTGSSPSKKSGSCDHFMNDLNRRARALHEKGLSSRVAFDMAYVEHRIENNWPSSWGNDLQVLIYGDFQAPDHDLEYPSLGITVKAGKVENTVIRSAICVVAASVQVREKSFDAVADGASRINTLLGIWTIIDWGNRALGWWCHLTSGAIAGVGGPVKQDGVSHAIEGLERLPPDVRHKVRSALYWIREPMPLLMERFKDDTLRVYAGYWNAFECLVEAVCLLRPLNKMKKQDKIDGMNKFLADRKGILDVVSLTECYRSFVDPGFVAKASHALHNCDPERAKEYVIECFKVKPDQERLYAVRNAINHGDINYEDLREIFRVSDRLNRLKMIVFGMLGQLIPFPYPLDSGPRDFYIPGD